MVRRTFQDTTVLYVEPNREINEYVSKFLKTFFKPRLCNSQTLT